MVSLAVTRQAEARSGCVLARWPACRQCLRCSPRPPLLGLQAYVLRQLRMNSDDVKLLYSYPSDWAVNLRRPDAPAQVGSEEAGAGTPPPACQTLAWRAERPVRCACPAQ